MRTHSGQDRWAVSSTGSGRGQLTHPPGGQQPVRVEAELNHDPPGGTVSDVANEPLDLLQPIRSVL